MKNLIVVAVIAIFGAVAFTACDPEPTTYTVTFNTNGGSTVASQTITKGEKATKPADPTKADYTFDGWYTDNDTFANAWDFATNTVTANVTLYAKWVKEYANITEPNGSALGKTFVIKGIAGDTYTDAEWNNVVTKIVNAMNLAYTTMPSFSNWPELEGTDLETYKLYVESVVGTGFSVTVETFTGDNVGKTWKTTDVGGIIINRDKIDSLSNLNIAVTNLMMGIQTIGD